MDIKKILENKRAVNIIIIFLIGICTLIIGTGMMGKEKEETPAKTDDIAAAQQLEKRLENILSTIEGAGKVSVFVRLEDYGESEYVKDTKQTVRENVSENEQETVMAGKTGDASPILVRQASPKIGGVIVTAKGAGNPEVKERIHSAVETSLSLPSYKVEVVKMK